MNSIYYTAYPELNINWQSNQTSFELSCPWISMNIEVDVDQLPKIREMTENGFNSDFLANFSGYPIAFARKQYETESDLIQSTHLALFLDEDSANDSPRSFTASLPFIQTAQLKSTLFPNQWSWDLEPLLSFAKISQQNADSSPNYDPLAAYTWLRRMRLVAEFKNISHFGIYSELDQLRQNDEAAFFRVCQKALRQTLYITSQCVPSLIPATRNPALPADLVTQFIREEKGHDRLVRRTMEALGTQDPESFPVFDETRWSMEILAFAAEYLPLAFCCIVGAFEGNNYADRDPLGEILDKSSRPESARGIETHFQINKEGKHSQIGEKFVLDMQPVSKAELIAAARWVELIVFLGNKLSDQFSFIVRQERSMS